MICELLPHMILEEGTHMLTTDELKDLAYLPGEIEYLDREINRLKCPTSLSMSPAQRKEYAAAVAELVGILQDRRQHCAGQLEKLRAFLDSIQDDFTRDLFRLKYEEHLEWLQIWNAILDSGLKYEPGSLRQICKRCLERYNRNEAGRKNE